MDNKLVTICPSCGRNHETKIVKRINNDTIKNVEVTYDAEYFYCPYEKGEDQYFCNAKMLDANLLKARNAYRKKVGLLTSDDIINIRAKYGLTQLELARIMNVGDVTITRYETNSIQEPIYDKVLREIDENPLYLLEMLENNKNKFSIERYYEIKSNIIQNHLMFGAENISREFLNNKYQCFIEEKHIENFDMPNIDLIEKMITYLALRRMDLGKTMLMKFLWYADKISFTKNGKLLTNLIYTHEQYGALPIGHYEIMGLNNVLFDEMIAGENIIYHVLPNQAINVSTLSSEVIEILDQVLEKFKDMYTNDIVEYMHKEKEYIGTKEHEIMRFVKK